MNKKEEIKKSIEVKYYRTWALTFLGIYLTISLLVEILIVIISEFTIVSFLPFLIFGFMLMPFILYYLYKMMYLQKEYKNYIFQEVILNDPHSSLIARALYFTVEVVDENQRKIKIDTAAIFGLGFGLLLPSFEEYNNKRVLIGYNKKLGEVVIIKLI